MKKTLLIFLAAVSLVSMNLFALGQQESDSSSATEPVDAIAGADAPAYLVPDDQPVIFVQATGGNAAGAETGTVRVVSPSSLPSDYGNEGMVIFSATIYGPGVTVPYVSGGYQGATPCASGFYPNVTTNYPCSQSPTASGILTDPNHGGPNSTMMPLPNSDGNAIHQANNRSDINTAQTAGCIGITTYDAMLASAQQNYYFLSNAANADGNTATVIKR